MKNLSVFAIISFVLIISCEKETLKCCSCIEAESVSDKYIFPIRPGMEEWKELNSHQAMVEVCQIPKEILNTMCTIGLVDTYLDYPILFTIFAFNNINEGLSQAVSEFNGFGQLLQKKDCATKFLSRYEPINPANIDPSWTSIEKGRFMQTLRIMEVTLAFDPMGRNLTKEERKKLIEIGMEKLKIKEMHDYSGPSQITNLYLIGNILKLDGYQPFLDFLQRRNDIKAFLKGDLNSLYYVADGDTIKKYVESFLKQH